MWRDGEQFRFASMTNLPRCGRLSVRQHRSVSCWIGPGGAARTAPDGTMKADNPKASAAFRRLSNRSWSLVGHCINNLQNAIQEQVPNQFSLGTRSDFWNSRGKCVRWVCGIPGLRFVWVMNKLHFGSDGGIVSNVPLSL